MADGADAREPGTRRACEACRRRKTRCTAERPVCSVCQSVNERCVYLPRNQTKPVVRAGGTQSTRKSRTDRVVSLESHISDIYSILESLPGQRSAQAVSGPFIARDATAVVESHTAAPSTASVDWGAQASRRPERGSAIYENRNLFQTNASDRFYPSAEELQLAVDIYTAKLHYRPLPLLSPQGLANRLISGPPFLCWSLLELCSHFHSATTLVSSDVVGHARTSRQSVFELVADGNGITDVLEALCILALSDMIVGEFPRAWMCISMASRLQSLQSLTISKQKEALSGDERASRCYWSIYLLESAFAHQPAPVGNLGTTSNSPFSGRHPPLHGDKGFMQSEVRPDDPGILAHCIDLVSVWGDLGSYMHELRNDQAEAPWLPTSTRTRIVHHLYESEGRLSRRHYLRNIKLPDRLAHLTSEEQEYWSCWALLQIASHAIPSVLSHPFIHLLTPKPKSWVLKPKVFLQETVDSALYNSAWVARLLQILDGLPIELNNPLIGHMVTATATVLWFFQFAQDTGVSRKARKNLRKCERFLERMVKWPHLVQKLHLLRGLQANIQGSRTNGIGERTTIMFQPSVIFALLDSNVSAAMPTSPPGSDPERYDYGNDAASASLGIQFIQPLPKDQDEEAEDSPDPSSNHPSNINQGFNEATGAYNMLHDEFFSQFTFDEDHWLLNAQ